jgi:hypothetical protein
MARGLGMMYMGRGMYNEETAQARSINLDTAMRWNEAMYSAHQQAGRDYAASRKKQRKNADKAYSEVQDRLRNHPSDRDINDGDALNTLLEVLLHPANAESALRYIKTPLRHDLIANIPFEVASEAMTICLERMTMDGQWPRAVLGDEFRPEREGLNRAIKAAIEEDKHGQIDRDTVQAVQAAIDRLRTKFESTVSHTSPDYMPAHWSLKAMDGITKMLDSPTMDKVLAELEDYQGTTLGDLLSFMHAFNLRFGEAKSYHQRLIYHKIYPMLAEQANGPLGSAVREAPGVGPNAASGVAKAGNEAGKTPKATAGPAAKPVDAAVGDEYDRLKSAAIDFFKGRGK